jgi:hypothetical protein
MGRFAAGSTLRCNPRLGAAGATRSQGLSSGRFFENVDTVCWAQNTNDFQISEDVEFEPN